MSKNACSVTRVIDLWGDFSFGILDGSSEIDALTLYKSYARKAPPAILHTSCESRAIGLKHYLLCFGHNTGEFSVPSYMKISISAEIYVNWEYDIICPMPTLYLDVPETTTNMNSLDTGDLAPDFPVERIALPVEQSGNG
ncbi:hypothetical protein V8E51_011152 [Hyaloscypha variabilis]